MSYSDQCERWAAEGLSGPEASHYASAGVKPLYGPPESEEPTLSESQRAELSRLKSYFPYRIVWGALNPDTGEFESGASTTKRFVNSLVRKGWIAWTI